MRRDEEVSVTLGDGVVVVRRSGSSQATIAKILGMEPAGGNPQRLFLDRIVHRPGESEFVGWRVSGAVVTMLERAVPAT